MICSGGRREKQRIRAKDFRYRPTPGTIMLAKINGTVRTSMKEQCGFSMGITACPFLDNLVVIYTKSVFMPDTVQYQIYTELGWSFF